MPNGPIFARTPSSRARRLIDCIERASTTPSPQYQQLIPFGAAQLRRRFVEQAEDRRAIIIRQLDQPGLGDEAAKLDQLARSLAALHDPVAGIVTGDSVLKPVPCRRRPLGCAPECLQLLP